MNRIFVIIAIVIPQSLMAAQTSTYSGQESRVIKSLSEQEIESLSSGDGMGFAMAAELNHYPGPRHVLMLSGELRLTASQQFRTQALYDDMRGDAVLLGRELLHAEEELDQLFSGETVIAESLEKTLQNIGHLRAKLRFVHLEAHLQQREILNSYQRDSYDQLRGYRNHTSIHDPQIHDHN